MSPKNKFYEVKICVNPINLWIKKICIPHLSLVLACTVINYHWALPNVILFRTFGAKEGSFLNPI
ncbi:MAG: hypothetical protein L3J74_04130 [Bacteroidales bacterium]|nr:hypothetical protein [Bacteroidales bacterium]